MPQLGIFVTYFNLLGLLLGFYTLYLLRDIHLLWNIKDTHRKFPGDRVVRIWCFHCRGMSSVPGWRTQPGQNTNTHMQIWLPKGKGGEAIKLRLQD